MPMSAQILNLKTPMFNMMLSVLPCVAVRLLFVNVILLRSFCSDPT